MEFAIHATATLGKLTLVVPAAALLGDQLETLDEFVEILQHAVLKCGSVMKNIIFTATKDFPLCLVDALTTPSCLSHGDPTPVERHMDALTTRWTAWL